MPCPQVFQPGLSGPAFELATCFTTSLPWLKFTLIDFAALLLMVVIIVAAGRGGLLRPDLNQTFLSQL